MIQNNMSDTEDENEANLKTQLREFNNVVKVYTKLLNRQKKINDPTIRYVLLIDKLCTVIDIGFSIIECNSENFPKNVYSQFQIMSNDLTNELDNLVSWVQSPNYDTIKNDQQKQPNVDFVKLNYALVENQDANTKDATIDNLPFTTKSGMGLFESIDIVNFVINVYHMMMSRQRKNSDPVLRYTLLLDKILIIIDMFHSWLLTQTFKLLANNPQDDYLLEINGVRDTLTSEINNLMDWIQSPHYSPDHPAGKLIMNQSKSHMEKLSINES
jgi:hypothetical protein